MNRYLAPVVGEATTSRHLAAACQVAARAGGQIVALIIGLVPRSLPMGSDVPELWSRVEYEAARARRLGRELGQDVETVLVLSDSAAAAVVQLAEEVGADAVCLAYEPGLLAALRRWRDPLWQTVLDESPCPVVIQRLRPLARQKTHETKLARGARLAAER
jgi:hypothetical protein